MSVVIIENSKNELISSSNLNNLFSTIFNSLSCSSFDKLDFNIKNYKVIDKHEVRLYDYLDDSGKVNKELAKNDIDVISIYESGISLEDYFKSIVKEAE